MESGAFSKEHIEGIRPRLHGVRSEMDSGKRDRRRNGLGRTSRTGESGLDTRRIESDHSEAEGEGFHMSLHIVEVKHSSANDEQLVRSHYMSS